MEDLDAGIDHLRADGLLAFPTETVWGLAARADSNKAMDRLCDWKGRAADQPISLLVSGREEVGELGFELSPEANALMTNFWPGPLTIVLGCRARFGDGVAREDGAVGVRCSSHPSALGLAQRSRKAGIGPLTATSFNRSGEPPVCSRAEAERLLDAEASPGPLRLLDTTLESGGEVPSTVVDLAGRRPEVLRVGGIDPVSWLESQGLVTKELR